jgi:hypothetical protein
MLRILLELQRLSGFLAVLAINRLLVCPHNKYVFVLMNKVTPKNGNGPFKTGKQLFAPNISSAYRIS